MSLIYKVICEDCCSVLAASKSIDELRGTFHGNRECIDALKAQKAKLQEMVTILSEKAG